jgi:hypothetical protein
MWAGTSPRESSRCFHQPPSSSPSSAAIASSSKTKVRAASRTTPPVGSANAALPAIAGTAPTRRRLVHHPRARGRGGRERRAGATLEVARLSGGHRGGSTVTITPSGFTKTIASWTARKSCAGSISRPGSSPGAATRTLVGRRVEPQTARDCRRVSRRCARRGRRVARRCRRRGSSRASGASRRAGSRGSSYRAHRVSPDAVGKPRGRDVGRRHDIASSPPSSRER